MKVYFAWFALMIAFQSTSLKAVAEDSFASEAPRYDRGQAMTDKRIVYGIIDHAHEDVTTSGGSGYLLFLTVAQLSKGSHDPRKQELAISAKVMVSDATKISKMVNGKALIADLQLLTPGNAVEVSYRSNVFQRLRDERVAHTRKIKVNDWSSFPLEADADSIMLLDDVSHKSHTVIIDGSCEIEQSTTLLPRFDPCHASDGIDF